MNRVRAAEMTGQPVIELDNVCFSYRNHLIIDDATVRVYPGEFVAVVGPNGSGKTTLLKMLLGMLAPSSGTVRIMGGNPKRTRKRIGYMPQYAHLDPKFPISALSVTLMGRLGHTSSIFGYSQRDLRIARQAMERLDMWDHRDEHFSELSGGQRRRVLIARALAVEPELLLLDEPIAGLDCEMGEELLEILNELSNSVTVVLVSHELSFVSKYVNKVICVKTSVRTHPTGEITPEILGEFYGPAMRQVRHDIIGDEGGPGC
jgi:zinc transport system ATP-binding protein